jgi:hypothetical protein
MMRSSPLIAIAAAASLAGCGAAAPTDKQQIASIIRREGTHPATLCSHLTDSLLARLGGRRACVAQAASVPADRSTHATGIRVRRNVATAVVINRNGRRTISLIKQRGVWKVSAVR